MDAKYLLLGGALQDVVRISAGGATFQVSLETLNFVENALHRTCVLQKLSK